MTQTTAYSLGSATLVIGDLLAAVAIGGAAIAAAAHPAAR